MSRILNTSVRCTVCGKDSEQFETVSRYLPDYGLDSKPFGMEANADLMECPHCHYLAPDLADPVSETVRGYVCSDAYTRWFAAQTDPGLRRLEGAALIAAQTDIAAAARWHLAAAWYCEDHNMPDRARQNRRQYLEMTLDSGCKLTPDGMLPYLDSLRQLGRFDEARALAGQLQPAFARLYDEQNIHRRILLTEQHLIESRDEAPHLVSEVM